MEKLSTTIPFSGFYETVHAHALDMRYSDDGGEMNDEACDLASNNHAEDMATYSTEYVRQFSKLIDIPLEFEKVDSPRQYNFSTDRIFAFITSENVEKLKGMVNREAMEKLVKEKFTSCDGFSSSYSNDYKEWLNEAFDHNQIGTLLECLAVQIDPEWEFETYENTQGNF